MIPYDDLVDALASWRARQGLPVAQAPVAAAPAPAPRAPAPPAAPPPSRAQPAQPPPGARTQPPAAPPRSHAPLPLPAGPEDDEALIESSPYDDGGEDYVVPLGGDHTGEQTAIDGSLGPAGPARGGKRSHDW